MNRTASSRGGLVLGLDLGTTHVKAAVRTLQGRRIAEASQQVSLSCSGRGVAEQNIDDIWHAVLQSIRMAGKTCDLNDVESVGVSSQGGAIQVIDQGGQPRGPVISWMDMRGVEFEAEVTNDQGYDWLAQHTGLARLGIGVGQILRLKKNQPSLLTPDEKLSYVGDYIVGKLCGNRVHDATSLAIAGLLNPDTNRTDDGMLDVLGLHEGQLPEVQSIKQPAGYLLSDCAAETGLASGIPVSPAVHDQYAAALAAGAVQPGDLMLGTGTAWVLLAVTEQRTKSPLPDAFISPHIVPNRIGHLLSLGAGGAALEWAHKLMHCEQSVDKLASEIQPGGNGLFFHPRVTTHSGTGWHDLPTASFVGLRSDHQAGHILRAILEGLVFELNRVLTQVLSPHFTINRIILTGAAATSALTSQIIADVTGVPILRIIDSSLSATGATKIAQALVEPCDALPPSQATFHVEGEVLKTSQLSETYQGLFNQYLTNIRDTDHV